MSKNTSPFLPDTLIEQSLKDMGVVLKEDVVDVESPTVNPSEPVPVNSSENGKKHSSASFSSDEMKRLLFDYFTEIKNQGVKRFTFNIPSELYIKFKVYSLVSRKTMTDLIVQSMQEYRINP